MAEIEEGVGGLYSLCAFRAENLQDEEIREIFGKFGQIARINRSNNLTFMGFKTLEGATLCYKNMQGDTRYNVRPCKKKGGAPNAGSNPREGRGEMNRNENFRGRKSDTGGSGDFGRPTSAPPPKLIPFPYIAPAEGASKPPPSAKVVVIGNLNPKIGQNHIYELCTKVKAPPLHVAMKTIKRPPYPNISYAFVYVRDEKEVESIVTSFNHLKLNGYKLVVSSVEKLAEEGKGLQGAK